MPILVKALGDDAEAKIKAANVMRELVESSDMPQVLASNVNALEKLYEVVKGAMRSAGKMREQLIQVALNAIASLASFSGKIRTVIFDRNYYRTALMLTKSGEVVVRVAACNCIVALARAERYPKRFLITEGNIERLQELLKDDCMQVVEMALAALANIGLDIKEELCNSNCVDSVIEFTQSEDQALRYGAIFAVKNLLLMATSEVKQTVLAKLPFARIVDMLDDKILAVQEQAMCAITNILNEPQDWISEEFDKVGLEKILQKLQEKIACSVPSVATKALYLLCNVANSSEKSKETIIGSSIIKQCINILGKKYVALIQGVMDLLIILLETKNSILLSKTKEIFKGLEVHEPLKRLLPDTNKGIHEKAKIILINLN
eukprot:TRINITY_DN3186_c0_g1_i4.p1 TRINITY_DN3186_c0_g1~~TRINITY_DN3186_c0_g1_i4.p1  ORF type:complete len:377 (-),score=71.51 TRINITY_DN3186_c0_g1_i4:54-1184(-)